MLISDIYAVDNNEIRGITISGGEPILPENLDAINYIAAKFDKLSISVMTNGAYIKKLWNFLPIDRIDKFFISLDGIEPVHMGRIKLRKPHDFNNENVYQNIINGIKMLIANNKEVSLSVSLDKNIYKYFSEFVAYLEAEGLSGNKNLKIRIGTINDFGTVNSLSESFNSKYDIAEMIEYFRNNLPDYANSVFWVPALERLRLALVRPWNVPLNQSVRCCNNREPYSIVFMPDGNVSYCGSTDDSSFYIGKYYPDKYFDLNKLTNVSCKSIYSFTKCKTCLYRMICSSGCPKYVWKNGTPTYCFYKDDYIMNNLSKYINIQD